MSSSPTLISLRGRVLAMRLALIVIAAFALPGAVRRVDESFVSRAVHMPGVRWRVVSTPNVTLRVLRGSSAEALTRSLVPAVERASSADLRRLGATRFPKKLQLFFVGSRAEMKPFVGWTPGGLAVPPESAAIFVANDSVRPALRHELMHVLSYHAWGEPKSPWLGEGLAMDAVGTCHGYTIDGMAAALAAAGELVPLADLPRAFDPRGETGIIHYTEAASVLAYVRDSYGREKLRKLWRSGLAGIDSSLGTDVATLERAWRARLGHVRVPARWEKISADVMRNGCE